MADKILSETFQKPSIDKRLTWHCPPTKWTVRESRLVIEPDAKTDYWQRTHYGFEADNGHFLFFVHEGDLQITTTVASWPANQYDQAGLLIRYSPDFWIKTAVEYETEKESQLGAVVTNHGYSDWSTQDYPTEQNCISFRIRLKKGDVTVEYRSEDNADPARTEWTQMRMAHLHRPANMPLQCGLYACSPKGAGFRAEFSHLSAETID
jgi:uncharacterized protein